MKFPLFCRQESDLHLLYGSYFLSLQGHMSLWSLIWKHPMKNRPGLSQLQNFRHLLAMPTGCQHLWTCHKAPGNFTSGKAFESLPHLPSGRRHALKSGRSMSRKMPSKEMVQTGVGPWLGPVTQASPAGSQQCWEQEKGPAAAKLSRTGARSQPWVSRSGSACWGWLSAILATAATFQGTLTSATQPLDQARHGDTSPTCLKAVLELDDAESEIESLQR